MLPDLPSSIRTAGKTTILPTEAVKGQKDTTELFLRVRNSEVRNARAVRACKANHEKLQTLINKDP